MTARNEVTDEVLLHDATAVSLRMFGTEGRTKYVARQMASHRWPHRKVGRTRYMTDSDIRQAIEIDAVAAVVSAPAPASGVSPKSRYRRAS